MHYKPLLTAVVPKNAKNLTALFKCVTCVLRKAVSSTRRIMSSLRLR